MTIHIHHLLGCRPTPLAHYLKALAILRLVGEQGDPNARGWWESETFHLATRLDSSAIETYFLEEYQPTPLVAPWNGGSGFYPRDNTTAIDGIAGSIALRFLPYREAIGAARRLIDGAFAKPVAADKVALLTAARRLWRRQALAWFDSAIVLSDDGTPSYPPMLGTGGNDGRLDFTNNFMQRVCELFDTESPTGSGRVSAHASLKSALWGATGRVLEPAPAGMFLPGSGGGPNSGVGYEGRAVVNPWDYVLMLEGAVCFSSALTQRTRTDTGSSSPFVVGKTFSEAAGYATAAADADTRGEQWLPLWSAAATIGELRAILAEGRRQVGRKAAQSSTDMARATARLGVARGVTAFERYGYLERNGQSFVAVPLGRWHVREQPNQRLLEQVHGWMSAMARAARENGAPASLSRATRLCQEATMACCRNGDHTARLQLLLAALGEAEQAISCSRRFAADKRLRALPLLDAEWVQAADDGSPEFELACALASLAFRSERGVWDRKGTIRRYFVPMNEKGRIAESADAPLAHIVDLERTTISVVRRALIDSPDGGLFPLIPACGGAASLYAMGCFLERRTDDAKVLALARPLMAIDWSAVSLPRHRTRFESWRFAHQTVYGLIRVAYAAWPDEDAGTASVALDPSIFHRLGVGDMSAVSVAARRLRASGAQPLTDFGVGTVNDARRLAAALAFGIDAFTTRRLKFFVTARSPQLEPEEVLA